MRPPDGIPSGVRTAIWETIGQGGPELGPGLQDYLTMESRAFGLEDAQQSVPRWRVLPWLVAVTGIAAAVYLTTLAPSITWAHHGVDGGDFAAAVATGGIPHPTGYPTYMLLGHLFAMLPWGDLAYRLNLMSATWAALTVAVVFLLAWETLRISGGEDRGFERPIVAAAGALAFAFSPLFWSQALIVEVYTLHTLFGATVTYLILRWVARPQLWLLSVAALAMGLGLGNHLTLVLLGPALLVLLWTRRSHLPATPGAIAAVAAPLLLGLSVYITLPLRAAHSPPVNWGDPQTLRGFLWLVTGTPYRRYFFALPLRYLPARLGAWSGLLVDQFGWWGLFPGLIGVWWLWQRARVLALSTLLIVLAYSIYAVAYDTTDSHVYLIPAYLAFALWLAWALEWARLHLLDRSTALARTISISALALVLVVPSLLTNFRALDLSTDREARDYGQGALAALAPDALLISSTDPHTFTLWYYRYAEGQRPDVAVVDDVLLHYHWYRRTVARVHQELAPSLQMLSAIDAGISTPGGLVATLIELNIERAPVYLTDPSEPIEARYQLSPQGPVYRVVGLRQH